jgi:hypothetical protein
MAAAEAGGVRGAAAYAGYRVWGSVGYIVVALTAGFVLGQRLGGGGGRRARPGRTGPRLHLRPVLFFAIALVSLLVPDAKAPAAVPGTAARAKTVEGGASGEANLRRFLLAFSCTCSP